MVYHSIVFRNPSSNATFPLKPKSFLYLRLVSQFAAAVVHSVWLGRKTSCQQKPVRRAINSTSSLMLISNALPGSGSLSL